MEDYNWQISLDEIEPEDINLKSFEIRDELNPYLWYNNKIDSEVRIKLLEIAEDFMETVAVSWVKPIDIVVTGSLANYNWSKYSDIDLHIIMDFGKVYEKTEFVEDYFNAKKDMWNNEHEDLKIYGYPVEVYVEDIRAERHSSGIFSLLSNKWLVEPQDLNDAYLNKDYVREKSAQIMTKIENIEEKFSTEKDFEQLTKLGEKAKRIFDELKDIRKKGLETEEQEMSSGNIIWKVVKRSGYIDKIWEIIDTIYNKTNSIY